MHSSSKFSRVWRDFMLKWVALMKGSMPETFSAMRRSFARALYSGVLSLAAFSALAAAEDSPVPAALCAARLTFRTLFSWALASGASRALAFLALASTEYSPVPAASCAARRTCCPLALLALVSAEHRPVPAALSAT